MPSLLDDFFHALTANSSNLLGGTQRSQASHGGLDNVLGIVGTQALGADVADAHSLHDGTDSAAGDHAGTFGGGLQQNGAGAEDADDIVGDGVASQGDLDHVLLGIGDAFRMASETSAALPRP